MRLLGAGKVEDLNSHHVGLPLSINITAVVTKLMLLRLDQHKSFGTADLRWSGRLREVGDVDEIEAVDAVNLPKNPLKLWVPSFPGGITCNSNGGWYLFATIHIYFSFTPHFSPSDVLLGLMDFSLADTHASPPSHFEKWHLRIKSKAKSERKRRLRPILQTSSNPQGRYFEGIYHAIVQFLCFDSYYFY